MAAAALVDRPSRCSHRWFVFANVVEPIVLATFCAPAEPNSVGHQPPAVLGARTPYSASTVWGIRSFWRCSLWLFLYVPFLFNFGVGLLLPTDRSPWNYVGRFTYPRDTVKTLLVHHANFLSSITLGSIVNWLHSRHGIYGKLNHIFLLELLLIKGNIRTDG